jgi:ubiquinone biosynthesis protein
VGKTDINSRNGHEQLAPTTLYHKPRVLQGKVARRVRKAMASSFARPSPAANIVRIKVGDDWGGVGHSATLRMPDELLPERDDPEAHLPVVRTMPRRRQAKAHASEDFVQMQLTLPAAPKVGIFRTLRRLGVWIGAFASFQNATLIDRWRGLDAVERRAVRLRQTFEHIGGTFVKIGQQMSSRLDMLPVQYCQELANMLDNFPPFPTEQAIATIERTTGKKLDEIFSAFDPEPIGSASIACVYQAVLRDSGQKVAVKIRRPNIRELFEADFRVIDLLTTLMEMLTIVRPGFMANLREEIRSSLSSELDFRREARLCELFQRRSRKVKKDYFTAPRIFFEYSSDEVLIQEFVSGMWLWEIMAAVEYRDPAALARMRDLNINPREIARRLIFVNNWGIFSHLAFHADPHPANIVVQANNKLVFVDFGACGYINSVRRTIYKRTYESFLREDPYAMAQCALAMLEPLPPMDINAITKDTENGFHSQLLAMKSKHSPWFERTTANMFLTSINITSKYHLPVPRDYLMFVRASLLYDTLCARLYPRFDFYKEYKRFRQQAHRKARKQAKRAIRERLRQGLTGGDYQAIIQMFKTGNDLMFRAQRLLNVPYDFAILPYTVEKWTFTVMMVIRFAIRLVLLTVLGLAFSAGLTLLDGQTPQFEALVLPTITSPLFLILALLLLLQHVRLVLFRLGDKTRKE